MRRRVRSLLALLSLSAVAIAGPALAQSTPQPPEPQPTGAARITGRVLARDDGAAVRRAAVRLSGVPARTPDAGPKHAYVEREVETDDDGAFEFAGLPGGSYYISVPGTNGFLELARARHAIVSEGRALEVAIRLERTGAIVGRLADTSGDGLLGIDVVAVHKNDFRGHVTLMADYGCAPRRTTSGSSGYSMCHPASILSSQRPGMLSTRILLGRPGRHQARAS